MSDKAELFSKSHSLDQIQPMSKFNNFEDRVMHQDNDK